MVNRYQFAEQVVEISSIFDAVHAYCADYQTDETDDFAVSVTPADIEYEREKSAREDIAEERDVCQYPDCYLEELAVSGRVWKNAGA